MPKNLFLLLLGVILHSTIFSQATTRHQQLLLDSMTQAVRNGPYTGINSILISHQGKLRYEQYFNGWTKDSIHDSRSSFKSVTSLLMGLQSIAGILKTCIRKYILSFLNTAPSPVKIL